MSTQVSRSMFHRPLFSSAACRALASVGALFTALTGCSDPPRPDAPPTPNPAVQPAAADTHADAQPTDGPKAAAARSLDVAQMTLPELGDAIKGLDGGRVDVKGPKGWFRRPRNDKEYLISFQTRDNVVYPSISVVRTRDSGAEDLTEANVGAFAELLQTQFDAEAAEKKTHLAENVGVVKLGDRSAVSYVKLGRFRNVVVHRLFIVATHAGREYTVELRTMEAVLPEFEPVAFAVANGLTFHTPSETPTE